MWYKFNRNGTEVLEQNRDAGGGLSWNSISKTGANAGAAQSVGMGIAIVVDVGAWIVERRGGCRFIVLPGTLFV